MIKTKERELKQIYAMVVIVFLVFLLIPIWENPLKEEAASALSTTRMWREERDLRLPLAGASLYPVSVQC